MYLQSTVSPRYSFQSGWVVADQKAAVAVEGAGESRGQEMADEVEEEVEEAEEGSPAIMMTGATTEGAMMVAGEVATLEEEAGEEEIVEAEEVVDVTVEVEEEVETVVEEAEGVGIRSDVCTQMTFNQN